MLVILMEDVSNLGDMGDVVNVSDGYGRNYLVPQGLALPATGQRAGHFAHQRAQIDRRKERLRKEALAVVGDLSGVAVTIPRQVGEDDKLYGSVTNRDIQAALEAEGYTIDRRKIALDHPLRELGVYKVTLKLHSEVKTDVGVWVTAL